MRTGLHQPFRGFTDMDRIKEFYNRLYFYPSDAHYIQSLCRSLSIKKGEEWRLSPIMGAQELSNTLPLANYHHFQYREENNLNFRFNLHMHTHYSDGQFDVKDLLDEGETFAKERSSLADDLPPFVLAITDHDCVDSCKEALKIIIQNPKKYTHLRVVLGAELSAVWKDKTLHRIPFEYEMLYYGLDPFDEKINTYLKQNQQQRRKIADLLFEILSRTYPQTSFSFAEALLQEPFLEKNLGLGFAGRIYRYAATKVQDENLYALTHQFHHSFDVEPSLDPYQETEDIFNLWHNSGFGFLGIAHPQKVNVGKFLNKDFSTACEKEGKDAGYELLKAFLDMLKNRGLRALEINYQFDNENLQRAERMILGEEPTDENDGTYRWLKFFVQYADKYGLLKAGGYDTHKTKITGR